MSDRLASSFPMWVGRRNHSASPLPVQVELVSMEIGSLRESYVMGCIHTNDAPREPCWDAPFQ